MDNLTEREMSVLRYFGDNTTASGTKALSMEELGKFGIPSLDISGTELMRILSTLAELGYIAKR